MFRVIAVLTIVSAFFLGCTNQSERTQQKSAQAELSDGIAIAVGPTRIPSGDAQGEKDLTVSNQYFALSFGVDTTSPWGVARGGILDVAIVANGELQKDFVSLIDFMPNYWSAWPSSYQKTSVVEQTPQRVVIRTSRDWAEVMLVTEYEILAASNSVTITTKMTNGGAQALPDLTTGYITWPNGGHLFGMPGITEGDSSPISQAPALGKWSAVYDEGWALGIFAPFADHVAYTGRDRYLKHGLEPGETREFVATIQIENSAKLSAFIESEIERDKLSAGRVSGSVGGADGQTVEGSAVIIKQDDRLHSWVLAKEGRFDVSLPLGKYELAAVAPGYSPGKKLLVDVLTNSHVEIGMNDMLPPSHLKVTVKEGESGAPLNAMISVVEGLKPSIKYFGQSRFFTELGESGSAEFDIAPGDYVFEVSAAGGFISKPLSMRLSALPGEQVELIAEIDTLDKPSVRNWYSADLHHHSDVLDGFTPPEYVLRSQRAAGIDLAFLSDHDSTHNNAEMTRLAATQGMNFIAGTELSASWAHFNAYPIDEDKTVNPEVGQFTVQGIFAEARRLGADVIHVNHPFGNYGYFDSLSQETEQNLEAGSIVPGGLDLGFDLIEVNSLHQPLTLQRAWTFWNQGKPAYFAAGSDVHDVWSTLPIHSSGGARSFVFVTEDLDVNSYVQALKAGHSYASQGPLIYPELLFGSTQVVEAGSELELSYQLQSVAGLESVTLIQDGAELAQQSLGEYESRDLVDVGFTVSPLNDTWYSLVVLDKDGRYAYSNPVWVKLDK